MPTMGNDRQYHGPNGPDNYISDNPEIELTRDVNDRITVISLTTILGVVLTKTITRTPAGLVTDIGRWIKT